MEPNLWRQKTEYTFSMQGLHTAISIVRLDNFDCSRCSDFAYCGCRANSIHLIPYLLKSNEQSRCRHSPPRIAKIRGWNEFKRHWAHGEHSASNSRRATHAHSHTRTEESPKEIVITVRMPGKIVISVNP